MGLGASGVESAGLESAGAAEQPSHAGALQPQGSQQAGAQQRRAWQPWQRWQPPQSQEQLQEHLLNSRLKRPHLCALAHEQAEQPLQETTAQPLQAGAQQSDTEQPWHLWPLTVLRATKRIVLNMDQVPRRV